MWIFMQMRCLTVRQRQRLCDLVAAGVTVTAAALVVGCSRQTASKWVNRGRRGEALSDRSSRPHRRRGGRPSGRGGDPVRSGGAAGGAACDRLGARRRCLDGARGLAPPWPLPAGDQAGRRGGDPLRARAARRADPRRHQEAGPDRECRATGSPATARSEANGKAGWQYLFVAIDDHTRLGFAAVYPGRDRRQRDRVPRRARPLLRRPRDQRRAGPDRQRQLLQTPLGRRLRAPRHHGQEDAALPATDKRQSGTVHPHPARALGLRLPLRERNTNDSPHSLPHSTSTIASVPTAPSEASHRSSASTTSLGQTDRARVRACGRPSCCPPDRGRRPRATAPCGCR